MIAALMALVVVTNGGSVSVQENLTDHDCAEARSVVLWGRSIEDEARVIAEADATHARHRAEFLADAKTWFAAHPNVTRHCFPIYTSGPSDCQYVDRDGTIGGGDYWGDTIVGATVDQPGDPKTAECVQ